MLYDNFYEYDYLKARTSEVNVAQFFLNRGFMAKTHDGRVRIRYYEEHNDWKTQRIKEAIRMRAASTRAMIRMRRALVKQTRRLCDRYETKYISLETCVYSCEWSFHVGGNDKVYCRKLMER